MTPDMTTRIPRVTETRATSCMVGIGGGAAGALALATNSSRAASFGVGKTASIHCSI
jgi:hypothetical protein